MQDIAGEHGVYVALAQLVGFEGGKAFPGGSIVRRRAATCWPRRRCSRRRSCTATLDFEEITRARTDLPLLADLEMRLPHLLGSLHEARRVVAGSAGGGPLRIRPGDGTEPEVRPGQAAPRAADVSDQCWPPSSMRAFPDQDPLAIDPELTRRWLVEFIRDEVQRRRGFERVVLGLSGGVDSSLVAYLAAEALGPDNVFGVRMPYRTSSPESLAHAQLVVDALGIKVLTVDISAAVDGLAPPYPRRRRPAGSATSWPGPA